MLAWPMGVCGCRLAGAVLGAGGLMRLGGAGWLQLRAGGHWDLQEKCCWFVVLGWWLWCMGVLKLVGAEDHALRATYVCTAT